MVVGKKRRSSCAKQLTSVMDFMGYFTTLYGHNSIQKGNETYSPSSTNLNSILTNKITNCVVIETSSAEIFKKGLPIRQSTISVITDDFLSINLKKMSNDESIENRIIKLCIEISSELVLLDGESMFATDCFRIYDVKTYIGFPKCK